MAKKLVKTGEKGGRPNKKTQEKIRSILLKHFNDWHTALFTAKETGLNAKTVNAYFKEFLSTDLEESREEFKEKQRHAKKQVLQKLDELILVQQEQLERVKKILIHEDPQNFDMARYESILQNNTKQLADIYQLKASLESVPTLDIDIQSEVEKEYAAYLSETTGRSASKN